MGCGFDLVVTLTEGFWWRAAATELELRLSNFLCGEVAGGFREKRI